MELKEGAVIADRFRLVRLLGQGGMGEVWAAQHMSLEIPCAVKFIHGESAQKPEVRARFEREAKAAAQLRSNNVVQILDYGVFEDTPYIAMEYLDGEPLSARLKRRGRLDAHETFRIVNGVAKALAKAHAAGIVHRDLKPENIFLVRDEDSEIPKVLDFGVAKQTDQLDSNTRTGALLGTPYFMSPEQAQGTKTIDHRADLWSLAVVVFRCVTGELPFRSTALGDLLIKIVTNPIPVPSQVAPGIPDSFDAWWSRAAQRDPAMRFQSAKELVESLGLALGVSMPSHLGQTPMPGSPLAQRPPLGSAPSIPLGGATVVGTPTGSGEHRSYDPNRPPAGDTVVGSMAQVPMGTPPAPSSQPGYRSGVHAQAPLGDSFGLPTVGGVAAPPAPRSSSTKIAVVAAIVGLLAMAGVGIGIAMQRAGTGEEPAPAAAGEPAGDKDIEPEDGKPAETASLEVADDPVADTSESASPDSSSPASVAIPAAPVPVRAPSPRAQVSPPPPPAPAPPPPPAPATTPRPSGTYDPGF